MALQTFVMRKAMSTRFCDHINLCYSGNKTANVHVQVAYIHGWLLKTKYVMILMPAVESLQFVFIFYCETKGCVIFSEQRYHGPPPDFCRGKRIWWTSVHLVLWSLLLKQKVKLQYMQCITSHDYMAWLLRQYYFVMFSNAIIFILYFNASIFYYYFVLYFNAGIILGF